MNINKKLKRHLSSASSKTAAKLLLPALFIMGFIILYPLLYAMCLSFFDYKLTKPDQVSFNITKNFLRMLHDEVFWTALKNTGIFTIFTVVISLIFGLITALAIDQLPKRLIALRGIFLVPWVIPGIVVGYLFMYMFDVEVGIINFVLQKINVIEQFLPWLMNNQLAMIAIIVANVWNQTPFYMLMFTAGLMAIPEDIKEAAYAEGAGRWQEFRQITLPHLKGIIVITSLLMVIRNFNNFPIIWTMTLGGPAYATTTSVIYIYRLAFEKYNIGYSAAVGMVWVLILLIISIFYVRALQKDF